MLKESKEINDIYALYQNIAEETAKERMQKNKERITNPFGKTTIQTKDGKELKQGDPGFEDALKDARKTVRDANNKSLDNKNSNTVKGIEKKDEKDDDKEEIKGPNINNNKDQEKNDKNNQKDRKKIPGEFPGSKDEFNKKYGLNDDDKDDKEEIKGTNINYNYNKKSDKSGLSWKDMKDSGVLDKKDSDKVGGSTTSGTKEQQAHHQQKVIDQFKKEQEAKKQKEASDDEKGANEWGPGGQPSASKQIDAYKKGRPSPASFKTNQRQTRELIKKQSKEVYPSVTKKDLNQFNRTKKYSADDGSQVERSTVFTKHYKTGKPLGVMTGSQRKAYDKAAAAHKAGTTSTPKPEKVPAVDTKPDTSFKSNKEKDTFKRRDQKLLDKGLKPPKYEKDSPTYTTKIGAFLNNKKVGDVKGKTKHTITKIDHNNEEYDAYDLVLDYIMESKQASSIEEANYIMIEMDQNTIHEIVQAQKKTLDEGIKTAVGLGMLALPYAMRQLEKRWNPVKKARDKYQDKKATEYEKKSGTTKEDGYFR